MLRAGGSCCGGDSTTSSNVSRNGSRPPTHRISSHEDLNQCRRAATHKTTRAVMALCGSPCSTNRSTTRIAPTVAASTTAMATTARASRPVCGLPSAYRMASSRQGRKVNAKPLKPARRIFVPGWSNNHPASGK
jgi:hypothetical protein